MIYELNINNKWIINMIIIINSKIMLIHRWIMILIRNWILMILKIYMIKILKNNTLKNINNIRNKLKIKSIKKM